jgi:hypothetical protein
MQIHSIRLRLVLTHNPGDQKTKRIWLLHVTNHSYVQNMDSSDN